MSEAERKPLDNKEVSDALCTLLHWALKEVIYETQVKQFYIVYDYIEQLEKENEELKKITQMYDAFGNDYMENDVKMIIADREYFQNGIFNESFIPKSIIKNKIKEYEELLKDELTQVTYWNEIQYTIRVLKKLLNEER